MKYLTIFALMLSVLAVSAQAEEGREHGKRGKYFQETDVNGDGKISREEFLTARQKKMEEHFGRMDVNNDGQLTKEELKEGRKKMRKHMKERREKRKERRESEE